MIEPVEEAPNIGAVLGQRLRAVGIATRQELESLGDETAFFRLIAKFPEDACGHTRLALAGAVRGMPYSKLDPEFKKAVVAAIRR
jgi:DNA transformation protein